MHLANARVMGLHQFLWTFGATYPPLLYVSGPRDGDGGPRDDLLPAVAGLALAGTLCAGLLGPVLRRWGESGRRRRGRPAATGSASPASGVPLVLLVRSPLVPRARWQNVVDRLLPHVEVLYGARSDVTSSLDEIADRNADQVVSLCDRTSVPGRRDVVLVGHGVGGLVALRVARSLAHRAADTVRVRRVVWVDAGSAAADGPAGMARDRLLRRVARCLRFGMGPLMQAPSWTVDLAPGPRARATARMRHPSTWTEARALWRATRWPRPSCVRPEPAHRPAPRTTPRAGGGSRSMSARDGRTWVAAGVLGTWLAASVAGQHPLAAFQRVRSADPLDLLIPRWRFFAPHPSTHDLLLFHQTVGPDEVHGEWRATVGVSHRRAGHAVWFPRRRAEKAQIMVCREILAGEIEGEPDGSGLDRLMARSAVAEQVRETGAPAFRYMVVSDAAHDPDERPRCRYLSPVVTLAQVTAAHGAGAAARPASAGS